MTDKRTIRAEMRAARARFDTLPDATRVLDAWTARYAAVGPVTLEARGPAES